MIDETARAHKEAVELVLRIDGLYTVEETGNDIVSARSLSAGKNDSHVEPVIAGSLALHELHYRHSVGVRKESLDLGLVADRLGRSTLDGLYRSFECVRKLWLICSARYLKI